MIAVECVQRGATRGLGIMGFLRIERIMGKKLGRHEIPRGFAWVPW